MSKAGDWAERLAVAMNQATSIDRERPKASPEVWAVGKGWYHYEVDNLGRPILLLPGSDSYVLDPDNVPRLLDQARWILDTFGER